MRKMLKSKITGEVLVVDRKLMAASEWLHYDDQCAPLGDYELDLKIGANDFPEDEFIVLR